MMAITILHLRIEVACVFYIVYHLVSHTNASIHKNNCNYFICELVTRGLTQEGRLFDVPLKLFLIDQSLYVVLTKYLECRSPASFVIFRTWLTTNMGLL